MATEPEPDERSHRFPYHLIANTLDPYAFASRTLTEFQPDRRFSSNALKEGINLRPNFKKLLVKPSLEQEPDSPFVFSPPEGLDSNLEANSNKLLSKDEKALKQVEINRLKARANWKKVRRRVLMSVKLKLNAESLVENRIQGIMRGITMEINELPLEKGPKCRIKAINPQATWKVIWNVFIAAISLLESCGAVYVLGFVTDTKIEASLTLIIILDSFLLVDIILKFFTAFYWNMTLITNIRQISLRYLKSFFIIDLVAVLPLYFLTVDYLLLKLLKIYYWSVLRGRIEALFDWIREGRLLTYRNKYRLLIFSTFFCKLLDLLLCLHIATGILSYLTMENGVSYFQKISNDWPYLNGFYFVACTVVAVGYGDTTIKFDGTQDFYGMLLLLVFTIFAFPYGISSLRRDFEQIATRHIKNNEKESSNLRHWIMRIEKAGKKNAKLPEDLKRNLEVVSSEQAMNQLIRNSQYIDDLPRELQKEVLDAIFYKFEGKFSKFFSQLSSETKFLIFIALEYKIFLPNTLIFMGGEECDGLYFILKGEILITLIEDHTLVLETYSKGAVFGEECLENSLIKNVIRTGNKSVSGMFLNQKAVLKLIQQGLVSKEKLLQRVKNSRESGD